MAIKLTVVEQQTAEEQRQFFLEQHQGLTRKLTDSINTICAKHRKEYEAYLAKAMTERLDAFLAGRKPNETAEAYYTRMFAPDAKQINAMTMRAIMDSVDEVVPYDAPDQRKTSEGLRGRLVLRARQQSKTV